MGRAVAKHLWDLRLARPFLNALWRDGWSKFTVECLLNVIMGMTIYSVAGAVVYWRLRARFDSFQRSHESQRTSRRASPARSSARLET